MTIIWPKDGKEMVHVPGGHFIFAPQKLELYLPEFWIDKTPVTNAEYWLFYQETGLGFPRYSWPNGRPANDTLELPVESVDWFDAVAYAEWAGKELPTEEQWEKAARGTDGREYPWGNEPLAPDRCNYDFNIEDATPVGAYSPKGDSPYGCVDMCGNVQEWTSSRFSTHSNHFIVRGGAWYHAPHDVNIVRRGHIYPEGYNWGRGFRCLTMTSPSMK
jgi:formylglycine-generating enzyme required for sulfatase activity